VLHLFGIVLSVSGTRHQAGKPQAMKKIIHAGQRILDPEFFLENALGLFGSQGAHPVSLGRLGQETLLEGLFFRHRQVRGPAGLSLGRDRFEAVIPIHIHPALYESSAAAQGPSDRWGLVTFEGQENGSIAVSLLSISRLTALLTQARQILRLVELDLHPTGLPFFREYVRCPTLALPYLHRHARIFHNPYDLRLAKIAACNRPG
jgi:hypothetical protein